MVLSAQGQELWPDAEHHRHPSRQLRALVPRPQKEAHSACSPAASVLRARLQHQPVSQRPRKSFLLEDQQRDYVVTPRALTAVRIPGCRPGCPH